MAQTKDILWIIRAFLKSAEVRKLVTAGEKPLVRDCALVFSPRAPFAFVTKIPKKSSNEAGGAEGGVWGGIPPRPPLVVCDDAISPTECDFTFLRQFLLEVRTFFTEYPDM